MKPCAFSKSAKKEIDIVVHATPYPMRKLPIKIPKGALVLDLRHYGSFLKPSSEPSATFISGETMYLRQAKLQQSLWFCPS